MSRISADHKSGKQRLRREFIGRGKSCHYRKDDLLSVLVQGGLLAEQMMVVLSKTVRFVANVLQQA